MLNFGGVISCAISSWLEKRVTKDFAPPDAGEVESVSLGINSGITRKRCKLPVENVGWRCSPNRCVCIMVRDEETD